MSGATPPKVAICTVVYNSADDLPDFLTTLAKLEYAELEIVLVDNDSTDGSVEIAHAHQPAIPPTRIFESPANLGFTGGMNRAIAETDAPYILALNADARPNRDFVCRLVEWMSTEPRIAAVTGCLTRPASGGARRQLDACGMYLTLAWRHFDRGSGEADLGQYPEPEQVFGATGAATLYRRAALDDVAIDGEAFLEEFHSFREDAELSFRLAERGWRVLYDPGAGAEHRRHNLPERRRHMSPAVNMHSLKNRYLIRAYHLDLTNGLLTLIPTLLRDIAILGYVVAFERGSLGAYSWLWRNRARIRRRRASIRSRKTRPSREVAAWFLHRTRPL